MYAKKLIATNIGVTQNQKDENKMEHTKSLSNAKSNLTRFTEHNSILHLGLDVDRWNNLRIAGCKTNEKTNRNTKQSINKGGINTIVCNRIMKYRCDQLKLLYLCEGNGVTNEGIMDPFNGNNKLDEFAINSLKDYKWFSPFLHRKLNPTNPEYSEGSIVQTQIRHPELISQITKNSFKSFVNEAIFDETEDIVVDEDITYFKKLNYWRNNKKYIVQKGCLLARLIESSWYFIIVVAICKLCKGTQNEEIVVIGHEVKIQARRAYPNSKSRIGDIKSRYECWKVDSINSNAYYYHPCTKKCKEEENLINHDWIDNTKIAVFWSLGMRHKYIHHALITMYDKKHFQYPKHLQYHYH